MTGVQTCALPILDIVKKNGDTISFSIVFLSIYNSPIIYCIRKFSPYDQASQTAKVYAREASDKRIADRIKTIEDSGTKIVKLDVKTQKEMRKQARPVYDAIKKSISKDIYNAYLSGVEK